MSARKHGSDEVTAILCAMGGMAPAEALLVAQRRLADASFDALIGIWEERLAALSLVAPPVVPRAAVWERIEAVLDAAVTTPPPLRIVKAASQDWNVWAPGLDIKVLTRDADSEPQSFLMRMQPGAVVPEHLHDRMEECLVIEGDLVHEGVALGPGDFTVAQPGGLHTQMTSRSGGLLYVRYLS